MQPDYVPISGYQNYTIGKDGIVKNKKGKEIKAFDNGNGYLWVGLSKNNVRHTRYIHRLLAEAFLPNPEKKTDVDHIDNDKRNNKLENLRWATTSENMMNQKPQTRMVKPTIYKGVTFMKKLNKWRARIVKDKKEHFIGYFETDIDAAKSYNKKAKALFGDRAYLNKIEKKN